MKIMNFERELLIEICDKCYLDCMFCSSDSNDKKSKFLNFNIIKNVINDVDKLKISKIQFSGGEPFAHPEINKIIECVKNINKDVEIYTSGNIKKNNRLCPLDVVFLKKIKKSNIHTLRFNLQSYNENVNNFLTNKNSFTNTISSIRNSLKIGLNCEIHIIPLKQNFLDVDKTVEFFKKFKVSKIKFLRFVPHGKGATNKDIIELNESEYEILIKNLIRLKKIHREYIEIGSAFNNINSRNLSQFCRKCQIGKNKIVITPDAKVYPCVSTKHLNFFNYSLKEKSLYEILNSEDYQQKVEDFSRFYIKYPINSNFKIIDLCPTQRFFNHYNNINTYQKQ